MATEAEDVASLVLEEFSQLPAKRKPPVRDNGLREWVPLSGIVVKGPDFLKCVALATGMKCLPASKISQANGVALHDWHAEVLTLRAFNRFILDECRRLAQDDNAESDYLQRRAKADLSPTSPQPFSWRESLTLHMYCSEAPCGDASMELIIASQPDATPWDLPPSPSPNPTPTPSTPTPAAPTPTPPTPTTSTPPTASAPPGGSLLLGRGHFHHLGIVRRKPARADAPPTHSKSCSDKIALKQCTSLLSAIPSLLVSPRDVYLTSLVLPMSQFDDGACRRCFGAGAAAAGDDAAAATAGGGEELREGRMAPVRDRVWEGGYRFRGVRVEVTGREFDFSRRGIQVGEGIKVAASNLAVAWTRGGGVEEGLVGGVLQGRKAFDVRGASRTSRRAMWAAAVEVAALLGDEGIAKELGSGTYDGIKEGGLLAARRIVKEEVRGGALKGWLRNVGDGGFGL